MYPDGENFSQINTQNEQTQDTPPGATEEPLQLKHAAPASVYPEPTKGFGVMPQPENENLAPRTSPFTTDEGSGSLNNHRSLVGSDNVPSDQPVPVVHTLSVRGVEYTMMTISLWLIAGALIWALLALLNDFRTFDVLSYPIALLLVCLPIFAFFFSRLKKSELANPDLRFDPSKRRLSQFTQIIAFVACLFNVVAFVYWVLRSFSGDYSFSSLGKSFLNLLVVLVVAGGVLAYYWFDEHRLVNR